MSFNNNCAANIADEVTTSPNESSQLLAGVTPDRYHTIETPGQGENDETTIIMQEMPFVKLLVVMCTAWLGIFLGAIDSTIIATLSGPICSEFNSLQMFSWVATAYLIGNAACQPLCGRLTDIVGRGLGLVVSNVLFAIGNLVCGVAKDQYTMILGRAIAGIGGGGLMCIATFLASDLIPLRKRGLFQGIANLWYGIGGMVGGVAGGFLHDHTAMGWRLAFLIQVPPAILCAISAYILVEVPPKHSARSILSRIDYPGVLLTVAYVVFLLLGLSTAGSIFPWTHPLPLTTVSLSLVIFILFVWWESKAAQPIIPVKLLSDPTVFASCAICFLSVMIMMTAMFYIPLYLQVRGESATMAGIKLLFSPASMALGALVVGYLMRETGRYVGLTATNIIVLGCGVGALILQTETSPDWVTYTGLFLLGGGYTAVLTTTQVACIAAVEHSQQAVITSTLYLGRSLGGTVGLALASAVYQNTLYSRLWETFEGEPNAYEEIHRIMDDLSYLAQLPDAWYEETMAAFMTAFHITWLTMMGWAILNLICVLPMKNHTLHLTLKR